MNHTYLKSWYSRILWDVQLFIRYWWPRYLHHVHKPLYTSGVGPDSFTVSLHNPSKQFEFAYYFGCARENQWPLKGNGNSCWSHEPTMHCILPRMHWACSHPQYIFGLNYHTSNGHVSYIPSWQSHSQQAETVKQSSIGFHNQEARTVALYETNLGPILQRIYKLLIQILQKICVVFLWKIVMNIRSQFCTCHDSCAVVACAKFWPHLIIKIEIRAKIIFPRFEISTCKYVIIGSLEFGMRPMVPCVGPISLTNLKAHYGNFLKILFVVVLVLIIVI